MSIHFQRDGLVFELAADLVDQAWMDFLEEELNLAEKEFALDIGCGNGRYTKALAELNFPTVIGLDFSVGKLDQARENCRDYENIRFVHGNAYQTGLPKDKVDFILQRSIIHHLDQLVKSFSESYRVLAPQGQILIQDQTEEDAYLPGSVEHINGYLFELFPKLRHLDQRRRPSSPLIKEKLRKAGFDQIEEKSLWEIDRVYSCKQELLRDLQNRHRREILHELTDFELGRLIEDLDDLLPADEIITEKKRWTLWLARK